MEQQTVLPTKPQSDSPMTPKPDYAPPRATFVPLKLEERLLSCFKVDPLVSPCDNGRDMGS